MRVYFQKPDIDLLRKDYMLVDMHFHSRFSKDSSTPVDHIVKRAKELGVHVVLTDHNAIGGVLAAEKLSPGTVKPGIEICCKEGKDIIPYFYTVAELEEFYNAVLKPGLKRKTSLQSNTTNLTMHELLDELGKRNCVIGLPHPFAVPPRRSYMFFNQAQHRALLRKIDAFEVVNQTMLHKQNLAAVGWAMQYDKGMVGGSDGHTIKPLGSAFTFTKAQSWEEFLDEVRKKHVAVIGEERKLRHQVFNATNLLREKAKVLKGFRFKKKQ